MRKVFAILLLLTTNPAFSLTGNSLNEWLKSDDSRPMATAFIYGVASGYREAQAFSKFTPAKLCFPEGVTAEQMTLMVEKQLRDYPAANHESAAFLTVEVLRRAFSCEKGGQ